MLTIISRVGIFLVCVLGALVCLVWMLGVMLSPGSRFIRIAVGLDCAASAVFGGDGMTTISKRAGLAAREGKPWGCILCSLLDKLQRNHCEDAIKHG